MPRLTQQPALIVERLAALADQIAKNHRDNLGAAKEAGDLLRTVPPDERVALALATGIGRRSTMFKYLRISEHWEEVQHCGSINEADKILTRTRRPGPNVPLPFESRCINHDGRHGPLDRREHDWTGWCVDDGSDGDEKSKTKRRR